jgi:hypothetical protein
VRQVAQATGLSISPADDYLSGRHLLPDSRPEQLFRTLQVCGETDPLCWPGGGVPCNRPSGLPDDGRSRRGTLPRPGPIRAKDARWFFGCEDVTDLQAVLGRRREPTAARPGRTVAGAQVVAAAGGSASAADWSGRPDETADTPLATLRAKFTELESHRPW